MSCGGASLQGVDPDVCARIEELIRGLKHFGYPAWVTSGFRTEEKQRGLYLRWLSGKSKYPAAPPGSSKHERGLAVDLGSTDEGLQVAGYLAPYVGLLWGGHFSIPDPVHFEYSHRRPSWPWVL